MEFLEKLIFRFTDLYYTKRTYGIGMINFQFNIYKKVHDIRIRLCSFLAYDGSREVKLYTLSSSSQLNRNIFEDAYTFLSTI